MTSDERAALIEDARDYAGLDEYPGALLIHKLADLLEADGKRLTIADAAPHHEDCDTRWWHDGSHSCTCWKADYDAAKEATRRDDLGDNAGLVPNDDLGDVHAR